MHKYHILILFWSQIYCIISFKKKFYGYLILELYGIISDYMVGTSSNNVSWNPYIMEWWVFIVSFYSEFL